MYCKEKIISGLEGRETRTLYDFWWRQTHTGFNVKSKGFVLQNKSLNRDIKNKLKLFIFSSLSNPVERIKVGPKDLRFSHCFYLTLTVCQVY